MPQSRPRSGVKWRLNAGAGAEGQVEQSVLSEMGLNLERSPSGQSGLTHCLQPIGAVRGTGGGLQPQSGALPVVLNLKVCTLTLSD